MMVFRGGGFLDVFGVVMDCLGFGIGNRAALELEKKTRASNLHHERGMEKTIDHLNREIVKLQAELVNLETKAREANAAAEVAPNPSKFLSFL